MRGSYQYQISRSMTTGFVYKIPVLLEQGWLNKRSTLQVRKIYGSDNTSKFDLATASGPPLKKNKEFSNFNVASP